MPTSQIDYYIRKWFYAHVAQLVEHHYGKVQVGSANLPVGSGYGSIKIQRKFNKAEVRHLQKGELLHQKEQENSGAEIRIQKILQMVPETYNTQGIQEIN